MMENPLFSLKSILATWQSSSPSLVIDIIFAISCGLLLFLLLLTCLESDPPLPPPRKHRNIRKHPVEPRWRSRKKSGALKACRDCLQEIEEARCLISLLQSHLGKLSDNRHSCQNPPGEVCKAARTGAHKSCCVPVENAAPAMSTSPSLLTVCTLPLASPLSAEHQDQPDLMKIPLGTIVKSSPPGNSFLASSIPAISGLGCSSYPMKFLSWWWVTTKALFFPTSSQRESQQEHLSHHPPEALFWGDHTDKQIETGSPSFVNPDVQKLLEIVITKKTELKVWKERELDVSLSKQKGLDYHLKSLGNIWISLGAKQDSTTPQPLWSMKDIKEQVPSPQQFSHHQLLGDHRQQKCSQLFWGLPSLHSESLVAVAWVARSSSYPQPLSVLFNGVRKHCRAPIQPRTSSGLSQAVLVPLSVVQPQPLSGNLPQSQTPPLAQIQSQTHLIPSLPIRPPSSLPQMSTSGVSCPTAQNKVQYFISPDIQYLELKRQRALLSLTRTSQEVFIQPTPNLPQNSRASHGHRRVFTPHRDFTSKNLQKQHLQKRLTTKKQQGGLHFRVQLSLEMMQAQSQFPGMCHAQDKKGPLQDSQKMESRYHRRSHRKDQLGKDFRRDLRQCMRRIPEVLFRDSNTFIVKFLKVNSKKKSERNLKPQKSSLGTCLCTGPEKKQVENILKAHLDRKLEQINKGSIPVSVGRSWLAANHVFPKCHTHLETRNQVSLKGWEHYLNTSCELSFLSPLTRQVLETHMIRFQERHRWGQPLQVFEPINLKLHETQYLPLPQACSPTSAVYVFGVHSEDKYTKVLGKPPQPFLGAKVIKKSLLTPVGPLSTTSPVPEEIQKTLEERPSGYGHGLSKVPLNSQEGRPPPHSLTLSLMGKIWQIGTVTGIEKRSLMPNPSSAVARNEPREGRRAILEMNLGSQYSRAEEAREAVEAEETPARKVIVGPSVFANSQTINMGMRRSESLVPDKSSSLPTKSVAQEEPCLKKSIASKFELQGKVESENQLQALATSLLLQDCHTDVIFQDNATGTCPQDSATNVLLQDSHNDVLLAADIAASHRSLRENTSGDLLAAQVPYDLILSGQNGQGQQEPRIPKLKDPFLSQSKMFVPTDVRENDRRPNQGEQNEGLAELSNSQAGGMSNPPQVRGTGDTLGSKYLQLLPEKAQVFLESHFRKRHSPQYLNPNKKGKGPKESLQKDQPLPRTKVSTNAQSQEPVKRRSVLDSAPVEAQVIVRAVGQILVEKLGLHQGLHAKELNQHKQQSQAPVAIRLQAQASLEQLNTSQRAAKSRDYEGGPPQKNTQQQWDYR
ncbi:spermatogenesis-associated protein 31E1 isoform X2 [Desmodus rotundus]|uniref:spermatogenesis-associated protein 31E1 isoform X2 n=1 Tax=Desmodus rotundus TaxID=9430 RepID=UPI00238172C2|nr:spermatogenesis-associated protein 31E1 isoform X2 [Desmodus rotundus]